MIHVVTRAWETAICVDGEFSVDYTYESLDALFDPASRQKGWLFAIDLTGCTYIDSAAISVMIQFWRRFENRFEVRIKPHGLVHRVLEICGFLTKDIFVKVVRAEVGP